MIKIVDVWSIPFEVDFDGTPFRPARTGGPPEKCYPAEGGEAEINSVSLAGNDLTELLSEAVMLKIQEDLTEYLCTFEAEEEACEADRKFDQRREEALCE